MIETLEERIIWELKRATEHLDNASSLCQLDIKNGDYPWGRIEQISIAVETCLKHIKSWQLEVRK